MKTAGIIAEYNPFHNGHKYHIEETRRQTGADYVITAISGDFVQRGAPALINKFDRARMALENGADLVLELPVTTALSSAEGFAAGGVCLFEKLGVVDVLSFGCEADASDTALFRNTAQILADEPEEYRMLLSSCLKKGMSFPKAREQALTDYYQDSLNVPSLTDPELFLSDAFHQNKLSALKNLLSRPNNILGLEYWKAIKKYDSHMEVCMISRKGSGYSSARLSSTLSSATAIREYLLKNRLHCSISRENTYDSAAVRDDHADLSALENNLPESVLQTIKMAYQNHRLLCEDDFSDILFYALSDKAKSLHQFGPANADLAFRTANKLESYENWSGFITLLKSKNRTYTGISRYLTHILLGITRTDMQLASAYSYAPYARILGFKKSASPLLKAIQEKGRLPIIMHPAQDYALADKDRKHLLHLDINASAIYNRILFSKSGCRLRSEFRQPLLYL